MNSLGETLGPRGRLSGNPELVIIAPNLPTPAYGLTGIPTWIIPPHRRPLRVGAGPPSGQAELQQPALSEHPETSKARTPAPSPSADLDCHAARAPLYRPRRFPSARYRSRQNSTEVLDELRSESPAERSTRLSLYSKTGAVLFNRKRHGSSRIGHCLAHPGRAAPTPVHLAATSWRSLCWTEQRCENPGPAP